MTIHPVATRTVPVGGVTINVREAGDPAGATAILLHGGSSSAATWDRLAASLTADGHHVIAADLRGHGGSSRTPDYPLQRFSDDIRGLMDTLGIESAALVGHSLGGYVASVLAQQETVRVTRLVLEEPGMPARDSRQPPRAVRSPVHGARAFGTRSSPRVRPEGGGLSYPAAARPDPVWWDRLRLITAPTLLISGGPASHIPPQQLAAAARAISCSRLVTDPGGTPGARPQPGTVPLRGRAFPDLAIRSESRSRTVCGSRPEGRQGAGQRPQSVLRGRPGRSRA